MTEKGLAGKHKSINTEIEDSRFSKTGEKRSLTWIYLCLPFRACLMFRRARLVTVEPIIFLFMFSMFLRVPLYEQYYYVSYGTDILQNTSFSFPDASFCLNSSELDYYAGNGSYKTVETWSDNLVVYTSIASHVPSIIVTILLGPVSDRFGRKPILFLAALGSMLEGISSIFILHFKLNPYFIIVSYFLGGVCGSFTGVLAASFSYVSDVSSEKWRGFRIGLLEAVFSVGGACGQFSVGFWLQWNNCDFIQPMWLFTACNVVVIFYILLFIPESLSKRERMENAENTPKGFKSLARGIEIFLGLIFEYSVWKLWAASLVAGLMVFNVVGTNYTLIYFLKSALFDFDALMIGIYQSVQSVSKGLSNTLLMCVFSALRMPEAGIAIIAVLFSCGCNLLTGFSKRVWQLFAISSLQGVESTSWTALRTLMSKLVAPKDLGSMFAILSAFEASFALVSSIIWPNIYNVTINHNLSPGTIFIIMSGVTLINLPPLIALLIFHRRKTELTLKDQNENDSEKQSLLHSTGSPTANGTAVYGSLVTQSVNT